jgi:guanylate kinase
MGRIFCVMGKSASGKDTIYRKLLEDKDLALETIVSYTTRPIRVGEVEGREYHFTDEEGFHKLQKEGRVIETRVYDTVYGPWRYFTVDDGIDSAKDYLIIGTLEQYIALRDYFGSKTVCPLYIDLDDGERLQRALNREKKQAEPKYNELCRRFLADSEDFSEDKLEKEKITNRFENKDFDNCVRSIIAYIKSRR